MRKYQFSIHTLQYAVPTVPVVSAALAPAFASQQPEPVAAISFTILPKRKNN